MLPLQNSCHIGKMSVHPANWESQDTDYSIEWYIHYRFHHPNSGSRFPKGYLVIIKGMNDARGQEKYRITRDLLKSELEALKNGYNPIPAKYGIGALNDLEISPYAGFTEALRAAFKLLKETATKERMTNALPHIELAAQQLNQKNIPVHEIRQKHLEVLLIKVARNKEAEYARQRAELKPGQKPPPHEWGPEAFNHYRAYLQMLFKQLKKVGATEVKPVDDIEKRKGIKKPRVGLSSADFEKIEMLKQSDYPFWRLIQVFFRSGARETEMMAMQIEHVDLANQRFTVLVKKGRGGWEWVWKTISWDVRHLWEEIVAEAAQGDFLFAKGLRPGPVSIHARNISIRWLEKGKKGLGIAADFYEFKHQYTTQVINVALRKIDEATKVAAEHNGHKSTKMNKQVYDLEANERLHRELLQRR